MIHLLSVAKSFPTKGQAPNVLFRPTSLSLPGNRRVAVLGQRREGKSVLLQMLAGTEALDQGRVIAPLWLSPVINSGGLLQPQLTVVENVRFLARAFGMNSDRLAAAVDALTCIGAQMYRPVKMQDANQRKVLEAAVAISIPFDCYLIDSAQWMGPDMLALPIQAAKRRGAGVIFATSHPRVARLFADFAVVIREQTLHLFGDVEEAIRFYDRRDGEYGRRRQRQG